MKKLFFILSFVGLTAFAFGQRTVSGTVTDAVGETLIGANVVVKGTTVGTVTDFDGNFSLEVPEDASTLEISYTGFQNMDVDITGVSQVDIVLESGEVLEEVVVTALGVSRDEKALGYAVQEVSSETIKNSNTTSAINALAGTAAGVQVTASNGAAGASSRIVLRGQTSFNGDNEALIVVDGVRMSNEENSTERTLGGVTNSNRAIDLNPDDIESITVLKGGGATALYGMEGARGVILITTKRGKKNDFKVNFNTNLTFSEVSNLVDRQDEFAQGSGGVWAGPETGAAGSWGPRISDMRYANDPAVYEELYGSSAGVFIDGAYKHDKNGFLVPADHPAAGAAVVPYDNVDNFFETGTTWTANLSASGGTEKTDYRLSFGYSDEDGITPQNSFQRINLGMNINTRTANDKLKLGMTANYVNSGGRRIQQGSNTSGVMLGLLRTTPTFDNSNGLSDAADNPSSYVFPDNTQRNYRGGGGYDNPFWVVNNAPYRDDVHRVFGTFSASYDIDPWLAVNARLGTDVYADNRVQRFEIGSRAVPGGQVLEDNYNYNHTDFYFYLNGGGDISSKFNMSYSLGLNLYDEVEKNNYVQGDGLNFYGFPQLSNASAIQSNTNTDKIRTAGVYGTLDFGYDNFLYLTLTGRNDWSSTLINPFEDFDGGAISVFYPSASLGLVFSELLDVDLLSFGKLRASYAQVGGGAPTPYNTSTVYIQPVQNQGTINDVNDGWTNGVGFPFKSTSGFVQTGVAGNPFLEPSLTTDIEFGVDLRFLRDRIGIDATYYTRKSEKQIIAINIANTTGFQRAIVNSGELGTEGGEVVLTLSPIRKSDMSWDIGFNFSTWKSTVESLPEGVPNQYLDGFAGTGVYNIAPRKDADGNIVEKYEYGQLLGGAFQRVNTINDEGMPAFDPTLPYNPDGALVIDDNPASGTYGQPLVDPNARIIGDPNPDWLMGITNTFRYKDLSLSFLFDIREGGDIWNGTKGAMTFFGVTELTANRGTITTFEGVKSSDGSVNDITLPLDQTWYSGNGGGFGSVAEHFIEDGSFRRLRYLTLSYNLGDVLNSIGVEGLTISFTGRNLWLDTPYTGFDPELSLVGSSSNGQGLDYFQLPNVKSYAFGISATF